MFRVQEDPRFNYLLAPILPAEECTKKGSVSRVEQAWYNKSAHTRYNWLLIPILPEA